MKKNYFIFTNHQKALSFLAKFSDKEFYEREVAKNTGISNGSANKVLNDLFSNGLLARKQKGKMYFYRISLTNSILTQFKIFNSIALLHPLITELKENTKKIILYGSCAKGTETSASDIDLFIISENRKRVLHIINSFSLGQGFEEIKIEPVVYSPLELLKSEKNDKEFLSLVYEGILLWEKAVNESGV